MARRDGSETLARPGPIATRIGTVDTPVLAAFQAFDGPRLAWLSPSEPATVGAGEAAAVETAGGSRFTAIRRQAESIFETLEKTGKADPPPASLPRFFGGFAFTAEPTGEPPWRGFPSARFVLPRVQVTRTDGETWLAVTTTEDEATDDAFEAALDRLRTATVDRSPPPGIADLRRQPDRPAWREQVRAAVERIRTGALEKVVLAQTLTARIRGTFGLGAALHRLGRSYPDCHRFAIDPGLGAAFFGATPERLVTRRDDRVETDAIAGSIGRGGTPITDGRLAERLRNTDRLVHEHAVVVDAIRDQLAAVADDVEVGERSIRRLSNVQHLDTQITARLSRPAHVLDLVASLHPTPAVGGRPPAAAERFIAETEPFDRGWYAAPIGWFDSSGDGSFVVGIRSAVASTDRATLFAGNGIVADSDADEEWEELQLKYRPILDILG